MFAHGSDRSLKVELLHRLPYASDMTIKVYKRCANSWDPVSWMRHTGLYICVDGCPITTMDWQPLSEKISSLFSGGTATTYYNSIPPSDEIVFLGSINVKMTKENIKRVICFLDYIDKSTKYTKYVLLDSNPGGSEMNCRGWTLHALELFQEVFDYDYRTLTEIQKIKAQIAAVKNTDTDITVGVGAAVTSCAIIGGLALLSGLTKNKNENEKHY